MGVKFPYIVLAQFIRETTYKGKLFNSPICKGNNNLCGMKFNKRGHAIKKERGHAFYANKLQSTYDYRDWQRQMLKRVPYPVETEEQYYYFLEHLPITEKCDTRYAEDTSYVRGLRSIVKTLKELKK